RAHHPLSQGFTFFYGHYNGNIDYFTHYRDGELDWHRDFEPSWDAGYSTDLIADEAAEFIRAETRERRPFFLYVPFNAPHAPLQAPERWLRHYRDIADEKRRTNAAMITAMDDGIGRILTALDRAGIRRNTLVWFFSDNGAGPGNNSPLRGGKGSLYEGGIRVPAAVRWPDGFEGDRKITARMSYVDVFPTLREAAGLKSQPDNALDGRSALPVLQGEDGGSPGEFYSFYQRYTAESLALIDGDWKLVRNGPPILGSDPADAPPEGVRGTPLSEARIELFHLGQDPLEKTNLAAKHPERVREMLDKLRRFRSLRPAGGVPPMTAPPPQGWKAPKEWRMRD
ncbi:MAG: sulfatase-like hydrolase/transferase, partial [bacterium]|nr:sulfatase-like hydrolase/transferase [bacterium]